MSEQQKLKEAAQLIKEMCSNRKHCKGCIFHDVDDSASPCELTNWPDRWNVERCSNYRKDNIILAIIATTFATNWKGNIAASCAAITAVVTQWNVPIATR